MKQVPGDVFVYFCPAFTSQQWHTVKLLGQQKQNASQATSKVIVECIIEKSGKSILSRSVTKLYFMDLALLYR